MSLARWLVSRFPVGCLGGAVAQPNEKETNDERPHPRAEPDPLQGPEAAPFPRAHPVHGGNPSRHRQARQDQQDS